MSANQINNGASGDTGDAVPLSEKRIFTTGEAAAVCKVSQQTIIRCFDSGRLGGFRVPGSKFRRIPREELIRFMKANSIPLDSLEGAAKKVLIVDDDPAIVQALEEALGRDGRWNVKTAETGYDAGLLTESFRPHILLLDYLLPDVNGNLVCARIRNTSHLRETKIIIVSGVVNQSEVQGLFEAGADDFVKKPFNLPQLILKMSQLTGLVEAEGQAR